ncbi:MAG: adenylate/guanylate cyclase domain-containing protein, partial [Hyphomicrobiaceae bacterium]
MKRKIAAIIAADVAGYSRLVEENEEDTLRRFIAASQVFKSLVQDHYGRIFNTAGDAILAEFPSPVEAVRCAATIQARVRDLNQAQPKNRQLLFRIGVSIGDVIEHENDLLGDGVNIAARLQTLASPGGLSISHWVHEQIGGKIQLEFRDAGWHSVKNIAKPVHVFLADIGEAAQPFAVEPAVPDQTRKPEIPRALILSLVAGVIAMSIAVLVWQRASRTSPSEFIPTVITSPTLPKPNTDPKPHESPPSPTPVATPPVTS